MAPPLDESKLDAALEALSPEVAALIRDEIARKNSTIAQQEGTIAQHEGTIAQQEGTIAQQGAAIVQQEGTIAQQGAAIVQQEGTIVQQQIVTVQMARTAAQMLFDAGMYVKALGILHKAYTLTGLTAPLAFTQIVDAFYRATQLAARSAVFSAAPHARRTRLPAAATRDGRGAAVRVCRPAVRAADDARRSWHDQLNRFLCTNNYRLIRS